MKYKSHNIILQNKIQSFFNLPLYSLWFFFFFSFLFLLIFNKEKSNYTVSRNLSNIKETHNNSLIINNSNNEKQPNIKQFLISINNTNFSGEWSNNRKYNIKGYKEKIGKIFIYFSYYEFKNNSFF